MNATATKTTTTETMARDFDRLAEAIAKLNREADRCHASKSCRDLAATYRKDARDLQAVLDLAREGHLAAAGNKAYWLDTAVRDEMPRRLYNALTAAAGYR